jgi:hypothetical protein
MAGSKADPYFVRWARKRGIVPASRYAYHTWAVPNPMITHDGGYDFYQELVRVQRRVMKDDKYDQKHCVLRREKV